MSATKRDIATALTLALILAAAFLIDRPVARLMAGNDPRIVEIFKFITWFGQGGVILYPAGLIVLAAAVFRFARIGRSEMLDRVIANGAVIFAAVAGAGLVNDALKILFGRARPFLWLAGDDSGFRLFRYGAKFASFPSGHTATSVAAAVALGALFPGWRWALVAFAALIAISRLAVGAHYPSDVVAGAAVGGFVAGAAIRQARIRGWIRGSGSRDFPLARVAATGNNEGEGQIGKEG